MGVCTSRPKPSQESSIALHQVKLAIIMPQIRITMSTKLRRRTAARMGELLEASRRTRARKKLKQEKSLRFSPSTARARLITSSPRSLQRDLRRQGAARRGGFSRGRFRRRLRQSTSKPCWCGGTAPWSRMRRRYRRGRRWKGGRVWIKASTFRRISTANMSLWSSIGKDFVRKMHRELQGKMKWMLNSEWEEEEMSGRI